MMKEWEDWIKRLDDLIIQDKELHDATVRLINAIAALKEAQVKRIKQQSKKKR